MLPYPGAFAICSLTIAGPRRSSSAIRRDRARTATVASHHGPAGPTGRSNPGRRSFRNGPAGCRCSSGIGRTCRSAGSGAHRSAGSGRCRPTGSDRRRCEVLSFLGSGLSAAPGADALGPFLKQADRLRHSARERKRRGDRQGCCRPGEGRQCATGRHRWVGRPRRAAARPQLSSLGQGPVRPPQWRCPVRPEQLRNLY
jgi:hypothetical protein